MPAWSERRSVRCGRPIVVGIVVTVSGPAAVAVGIAVGHCGSDKGHRIGIGGIFFQGSIGRFIDEEGDLLIGHQVAVLVPQNGRDHFGGRHVNDLV